MYKYIQFHISIGFSDNYFERYNSNLNGCSARQSLSSCSRNNEYYQKRQVKHGKAFRFYSKSKILSRVIFIPKLHFYWSEIWNLSNIQLDFTILKVDLLHFKSFQSSSLEIFQNAASKLKLLSFYPYKFFW